jgi:hypothetical protein
MNRSNKRKPRKANSRKSAGEGGSRGRRRGRRSSARRTLRKYTGGTTKTADIFIYGSPIEEFNKKIRAKYEPPASKVFNAIVRVYDTPTEYASGVEEDAGIASVITKAANDVDNALSLALLGKDDKNPIKYPGPIYRKLTVVSGISDDTK